MKYLGIDFGLKNLGLAYAESPLSEPLTQYHYVFQDQALKFISSIINQQHIDIIIIGLPEGKLANKVKNFANKLKVKTNLPVYYQDETLSTQEAKAKMIQAHLPQKKRRQDHSRAAAIILQSYLDDHQKA